MLTTNRTRSFSVTRVIKLSRSPKASRDARSSLILNPRGSSSFSSLPSTSSTITGPAGSKLAQAQVELQACERQLAEKERDLAVRRISTLREGLGGRCRALIDCGWIWGEMGKQGLRALQSLTTDTADPHSTFPGPMMGSFLHMHVSILTAAWLDCRAWSHLS